MIGVDRQGFVDPEALTAKLDTQTLVVSVALVNNEIGTIQDLAQIGKRARAVGAIVHCDAAQGPCAVDMNVLLDHADLISLSAHKLYGPCGIGVLIARRDIQTRLTPLMHGGGQQNGLRSGTLPLALCVGFGAAAELMVGEVAQEERERVRLCREQFIEALIAQGCDFELNGPGDHFRHPGNANVLFRGIAAADILAAVQPMLAASSGSACTSGIPEPSHVLRAIGRTAEEADSSVRFSFGRLSTIEDAQDAAKMTADAVRRLS